MRGFQDKSLEYSPPADAQDWGPDHAGGGGAQCAHPPGAWASLAAGTTRAPPSARLAPSPRSQGGGQQPGPGSSQLTRELGLLPASTPRPPPPPL